MTSGERVQLLSCYYEDVLKNVCLEVFKYYQLITVTLFVSKIKIFQFLFKQMYDFFYSLTTCPTLSSTFYIVMTLSYNIIHFASSSHYYNSNPQRPWIFLTGQNLQFTNNSKDFLSAFSHAFENICCIKAFCKIIIFALCVTFGSRK